MAHKSNNEGQIKTYSLRSSLSHFPQIESAMLAYTTGYNAISKWIAENMLTLTLGDCAKLIEEAGYRANKKTGEDNGYYKTCIENAGEKLYRLFCKNIGGANDANNILFIITKDCDNYQDNPLGLSETDFKREGYFKSVIGNYKSKFANFKLSVRKRKIDENSSFADKVERIIYESVNNKKALNSEKDWDELINFVTAHSTNNNADYLSTLNTLKSFFVENKEYIDQYREEKVAQELQEFILKGCSRKNECQSMTFLASNGMMLKQDVNNPNRLVLTIHCKNNIDIPLLGHHQLMQNGELTVDTNTLSKSVTLLIKKNGMRQQLFANIQLTQAYEKKPLANNLKPVGCDVNSKHILLATSIDNPDSIKGYCNIYKHLIADAELKVLLKKQHTYKIFESLASFVNFGFLESDSIYARFANHIKHISLSESSLDYQVANRINEVLKRLMNEEKDQRIKLYIGRTMALREYVQKHFSLKMAFKKYQKIHDDQLNAESLSKGLSNEEAKSVLWNNPFRETEQGVEILEKMRNCSEKVIANRDRIIEYAQQVMEENGYNIIVLENLESSQFERRKSLPTVLSLLNYHKFAGKTLQEIKNDPVKAELFNSKGDCFDFKFDEEGRIVDATLSAKGSMLFHKDLFFNDTIKTIHFADVKDKFIQLDNNGSLKVALAPAQLSSQMDSIEHKLYVEKLLSHAGKPYFKKVDKREVRKEQEWHINGLNADFNSARNLAFYIEDERWTSAFLKSGIKTGSNGFGSAEFVNASHKDFNSVKNTIEKMGQILVVRDNTEAISKAKKSTTTKSINSL